jgi:hypothetical protein
VLRRTTLVLRQLRLHLLAAEVQLPWVRVLVLVQWPAPAAVIRVVPWWKTAMAMGMGMGGSDLDSDSGHDSAR